MVKYLELTNVAVVHCQTAARARPVAVMAGDMSFIVVDSMEFLHLHQV